MLRSLEVLVAALVGVGGLSASVMSLVAEVTVGSREPLFGGVCLWGHISGQNWAIWPISGLSGHCLGLLSRSGASDNFVSTSAEIGWGQGQ